MKTADSIEEQPERKAARGDEKQAGSSPANTRPARGKLPRRDPNRIAAWRWQPGHSGNPSGRPKHDLAAEIARAAFENNADALYRAFSKALLRGNGYVYKELADRAYGKMREKIEVDVSPYRTMPTEDLEARCEELQRQLGLVKAPPATDDSDTKVN